MQGKFVLVEFEGHHRGKLGGAQVPPKPEREYLRSRRQSGYQAVVPKTCHRDCLADVSNKPRRVEGLRLWKLGEDVEEVHLPRACRQWEAVQSHNPGVREPVPRVYVAMSGNRASALEVDHVAAPLTRPAICSACATRARMDCANDHGIRAASARNCLKLGHASHVSLVWEFPDL